PAGAGRGGRARRGRGRDRVRPLAAGEPAEPGALTVIVPARDEEHRIGPLLEAITRMGPSVREAIIVDDGSGDATADVVRAAAARDPRIRLVGAGERPSDWVGKQHALQQGLAEARAPWALCLDADARPDPALPDALLAAAAEHGYDAVTAGPRFAVDTVGEAILHPALLATLVYRFGPPTPAPAASDRIVANGQCLLVEVERFRAAGAWAPVRAHMTEDVALARHLVRTGWRVGMADAAPLLVVDMHASGREAWREWGRSLALPGVASGREQALDILTLLLTLALPPWLLIAALLVGSWWVAVPSLVLLAVRLLFHVALRSAYDHPGRLYWLAPLADGAAVVRLIASAVRPNRRWRGRTYARSS
ncbi:MAG: glycosyltransferase, partial [Gaiellales bacterium]